MLARMIRIVLCAQLMGLLAVAAWGASRPALAADRPEFGVLYIGNHDDLDARVVRDTLLSRGWAQEVYKSSRSRSPLLWPAHYHFTHGIDDRGTEAGDDADLLYISGHGYSRAYFPIFRYGVAAPVDSISPDTNCTNTSPWEVGVDWRGRFPSNESRWDDDIEWAIFAACSQLDWRTPPRAPYAYSATWPRDSAAKAWARTLLGEPNRMHAILGYWGTAPSGTTDVAIARRFFRSAIDMRHSVASSWMEANQPYGVPWAILTHAENRWDRLHGVGTGPTPDTRADQPYKVDYYRYGIVARIVDGRGGAYEELSHGPGSSSGSWLARWWRGVRDLLEPDVAYAGPRLPDHVEAPGLRLDVDPRTRARGEAHQGAPRAVRAVPVNGARYLREAATITYRAGRSVGEVRESRTGPPRAEDVPAGAEPGVTVSWPSGLFEYHRGGPEVEKEVGSSPQEAVAQARRYLRARDELPDDAYVADVWAVTKATMDPDSDEQSEEQVIRYDVRLGQRLDGLCIDGGASGILVSLDAGGVRSVYKRWFEPVGEPATTRRRPISGRRALESVAAAGRRQLKLPERATVHSVDLVYHPSGADGGELELRPAWRVGLEDGSASYVDASTGRVGE